MRPQRNNFRSLADVSVPSVWTWIVPVLAGTAVYFAFAEKLELWQSYTVWWEELLEVAPALLVGLLFQGYVLLPLRVLFARGQINSPLLFLAVSSLIWIAAGATILSGTNALSQDDLWVDALVIVPGCVITVAFTLMNLGTNDPPRA